MRENVKKVIMYMTLGIDMSRLFSEMVMASQLGDTVQKKMIYLYLTTYAEQNADLAILAVNTLQKDTKDVDPSVRGVALRSLCAMQIPNIIEYLEPAIFAGLSDPSGYVRRTAVLGVVKLPSGHLVDKVKDLLVSDQDPNVVSNCISVLHELSQLESLVDKALVYAVLNRFQIFSEWGKCQALEHVISRHFPSDEDEIFDLLNALDPFLKQTSVPVSLAIMKQFLVWTCDNVDLHRQVLVRIKDPLLTLLSSAAVSPEMEHVILGQVKTLIACNREMAVLLAPHWKHFVVRVDDTVCMAELKLEILSHFPDCAREIEICFKNENLVKAAVNATLHSLLVQPDNVAVATSVLMDTCLCGVGSEKIVGECLLGLKMIVLKFPQFSPQICNNDFLLSVLPLIQDYLRGLEAVVFLLGRSDADEAPYMLEDIFDLIASDRETEEPTGLKQSLLTSAMRLFTARPLETRELLRRTLFMGIEESSDPHVRDIALFYFRFLKSLGPLPVDLFTTLPVAAGLHGL